MFLQQQDLPIHDPLYISNIQTAEYIDNLILLFLASFHSESNSFLLFSLHHISRLFALCVMMPPLSKFESVNSTNPYLILFIIPNIPSKIIYYFH